MLAGRLMRGRCETSIPAAPAAPMCNDDPLVGLGKIPDFVAGVPVVHNCADWNFQRNAAAIAPGLVRPFAVASALGFVFRIEAEVDQRIVSLAGLHDDVPPLATITTRRSAARNKFLPAECETTVATVAGFDSDCGFVDEHGRVGVRSWFLRVRS